MCVKHGVGIRQHLPDGEVHWPDQAPVAWAGECWAVEAELTPKTVARTTAIMREILSRTGDYGCPAADAAVPGRPPRHARALYLCSPAALTTVLRSRAELGPLGARIEVRDLPPDAVLNTHISLTVKRSVGLCGRWAIDHVLGEAMRHRPRSANHPIPAC